MEQKPKLKAFNLEEALKDVSKVRNANKAIPVQMYKGSEFLSVIYPDGSSSQHFHDGEPTTTDDCDLFLIDETPVVEMYINVFQNGIAGGSRYSLEAAIETVSPDKIAVLKLTISGSEVTSEIVHHY